MTEVPDIIVVDIFREIAAAVEAEAITLNICTTLRYEHGTPEELLKVLQNVTASVGLDNTVKPKYPLMFLLSDFPETVPGTGGYDEDVVLPVIVLMGESQQNYSSQERYDSTLKPLLLPLYKLTLKHIAKHPRIMVYDPKNIPHTKWNRLFYGRQKLGTTVADYVDAVELEKIKLTFAKQTSC